MKIYVVVCSEEEREELFVEAWIDNLLWCEMTQERGEFSLTFLPWPDINSVKIEFDIAMAVLKHMKRLPDGRWRGK